MVRHNLHANVQAGSVDLGDGLPVGADNAFPMVIVPKSLDYNSGMISTRGHVRCEGVIVAGKNCALITLALSEMLYVHQSA